jgi:hypothetical protein
MGLGFRSWPPHTVEPGERAYVRGSAWAVVTLEGVSETWKHIPAISIAWHLLDGHGSSVYLELCVPLPHYVSFGSQVTATA